MAKAYKRGAEIANDMTYPDLLDTYIGKNVTVVYANPDSRPRATVKLTRRDGRYFVGNHSLSPGDGVYSKDMTTFIGRVARN